VAITGFKVKNKAFPFETAIAYKKQLNLNYDQNFISFEFASLDYNDPEKNQYAYKLEGFDEDWVYTGNRRFAAYTGLPPGSYVFRVKGSNNDGYWNEAGTSLAISIATPPWKTGWAYMGYILVVVALIAVIVRYYLRRQHLLHRLELEHLESNKLKEIDSMKSRFFTNISHEFRTPLTLILGPLQKMIGKTANETYKRELTVMQRNARRLQQLINQLLDLSKLEAGKMELQCAEMNLVEWVRMYIQSFESLARQRKIDFVFEAGQSEIICWFDPEKMARVLNNLLSNAFKFTESGGEIEVVVSTHTPLSPPEGGKHPPAGSIIVGEIKSPPTWGTEGGS
jgi:signal transduction histidine kinase